MNNSGVVIPSELGKIIKERDALWQQVDKAQNQFKEMSANAAQVDASLPAQIPSFLTDEATPCPEIMAASQNFKSELGAIAKSQEVIKMYRAEIKKIENQRTTMIIIGGIVIAIILCIVVSGGLSVINSLLN